MGLDTIIASIREEAELDKQKILSNAEKRAEEISAQAKIDAQNEYESILADTEIKCKSNLKSAYSTNLALDSKSILTAKVEAIYDVLSKLKNSVISLPEKEYFDFMKRLIVKYASKEGGEIAFGKSDFARIPEDFLQNVNSELKNKVTLSSAPAEIEYGFILKFGDIEENCGIDALIEDNKDALKDKIAEILFGE